MHKGDFLAIDSTALHDTMRGSAIYYKCVGYVKVMSVR